MAGQKFNQIFDRTRKVLDDFVQSMNENDLYYNTLFFYDFNFGIRPDSSNSSGILGSPTIFELSIRININYHTFILENHKFSIENLLHMNTSPSIAVEVMKDSFAEMFEKKFNRLLINGLISGKSQILSPIQRGMFELFPSSEVKELKDLVHYINEVRDNQTRNNGQM